MADTSFSNDPGIVVFAYSDVGYACLKRMLERGVKVRALFTHEDSPEEEQWFGSVSALAQSAGIPVYRPEKLTRAEHEALIFDTLGAKLLLSFYYRNLLPTWLWSGMQMGAFNMHGSYLPSYRGRAPLNWAIINGESYTGVTLHFMVKEADAGDIVDQEKVMIGAEETAISVRERSCEAAVRVIDRQLDNLLRGTPPRHEQDASLISYFGKRTPEDGRIDWDVPARSVFNLVRALTRPYPGAFTEVLSVADAAGVASCEAAKPLACEDNKNAEGEGSTGCCGSSEASPPILGAEPAAQITEQPRRLFVWWGKVRDDLHGVPGEVLSRSPLVVACKQGAFEITDATWAQ